MTRGRNPMPPQVANIPQVDAALVEADLQAADQLAVAVQQQDARVRAVAEQIGYQLPANATDPDLIARDISANMRRSVEACIEIGRGLMVLREACQHGEFANKLEVLTIHPRMAQRFMQAAVKFSNASSTSHLIKAAGTQTKLMELLILDDEQIKELSEFGQTGELALDDIACMSTSELRAALRKAKRERAEEAEAERRIREQRDATINKLQADNDRLQRELAGKPQTGPEDEAVLREQWALDALASCTMKTVAAIDVGLRKQINLLEAQFGEEPPPNHVRLAQQQAITQVIQAARVLAADFGIDLPLSTQTPQELAWLANMEELEAMSGDQVPQAINADEVAGADAAGWDVLDAEGRADEPQ